MNLNKNNQAIIDNIINHHNKKVKKIINYNNNNYEFELKRLSGKELMELNKIEAKGRKININTKTRNMKQDDNIKVDENQILDNYTKMIYTALKYSLELDIKQLYKLPNELILNLFNEVIAISNADEGDVKKVNNFLKK